MHKRFFLSGLSIILLFFIAACSQINSPTNLGDKTGNLELTVSGAESAQVSVSKAGEEIFNGSISGSHMLEGLAVGDYTIDGLPSASSIDPSSITASVEAGKTARVELVYSAMPEASGIVTSVSIVKVLDDVGKDLPYVEEANKNKPIDIYAAQTEEPVCITVHVADENGKPVANAPLSISLSDAFGQEDRVAIIRGCSTGLSSSATRDGIYTDQDGKATFTLFATDGTYEYADSFDVAKITVAAENKDGSAALTEAKIVFYNIAHLWVDLESHGPVPTDQRIGASFEKTNIFNTNNRTKDGSYLPADNAFEILTLIYSKEPQLDVSIKDLGFIKYEIIEEKSKKEASDVAHLYGCDSTSGSTDVCAEDHDGLIYLRPNKHIDLMDLPICATVKATLYTKLIFGDSVYYFPLKDYYVQKCWIGSFAHIDKTVDHHVLTWAGYEHTLDAADDPHVEKDSVFTSTITIKATNQGHDPIYNLSIEDELPAELGIIESSVHPNGGTYDHVTHTIGWNWSQNKNQNPKFVKLDPGEHIEVSFQVYLRQKPGFCVDYEDLEASKYYRNQWTFATHYKDHIPCYTDPYKVINGAEQLDVTVSWYSGAPITDGGIQSVADFNGWVNEHAVVIYGVRPVFDINKELYNTRDLPFEIGMDAFFSLDVTNLDRPEYAHLAADYPSEFDGSDRDNPYGHEVNLEDVFSYGLDFVDSARMKLVDDDGVKQDRYYDAEFVTGTPEGFPELRDKLVKWDTIDLMGGGDNASVDFLILANDLYGAHTNLAFMTAKNLNQFDRGDCPESYGDTLYATFKGRVIADCAYTHVLKPDDPWLEISNKDNFEGWLKIYIKDQIKIYFDSTIEVGDEYYYLYSLQNSGDAPAYGTTFDMSLDSTDFAHISAAKVFLFDEYFNFVGAEDMSTSSSKASFGKYKHPAGYTALFVVYAEAKKVGNVVATANANWKADVNNTQYPLLPLGPVVEHTSIAPPF